MCNLTNTFFKISIKHWIYNLPQWRSKMTFKRCFCSGLSLLILSLVFCSVVADDRDELKDILGSGEVQKSIEKTPSTSATTPASPQLSNSSSNAKKLNIVVSSIDEAGVKEDGQTGTEVSVASDENFTSNDEKAQTKTNHVSLILFCLVTVRSSCSVRF